METKFKYDDEILYIYNNKLMQGNISKITITITITNKINSSLINYTIQPHGIVLSEDKIFFTFEELIESFKKLYIPKSIKNKEINILEHLK